MENADFKTIVERAISGNAEAFARLCHEKGGTILYLCHQMMGNKQDAEDAAQEVVLRMYRKIGELQHPEAFANWMRRIVVTTCSNMRRKNMKDKYHVALGDFEDSLAEDNLETLPEDYVLNGEKKQQLIDIINNLPRNMRMSLVLFYFENMSYADIASTLNTTEGTVHSNLQRAKKKIRSEIERQEPAAWTHATVPMAALGEVFRQQAQEIYPETEVEGVIRAALGIRAGSHLTKLGKWAAQGAIVLGVVAAGVFALFNIDLTNSRPQAMQGLDAPPGSSAVLADQEFEDTVSDMDAAVGIPTPAQDEPALAPGTSERESDAGSTAQSSSSASSGGSKAPTEDDGEHEGGVLAEVRGRLALVDAGMRELNLSIAKPENYTAYLAREDSMVASARLSAQGRYIFENVRLQPGAEYQVVIRSEAGSGFVFVGEQKDGAARFIAGEQRVYDLDDVWVSDSEPPEIRVSLRGAQGEETWLDPVRANIIVEDLTQTSVTWRICAMDADAKEISAGAGEDFSDAVGKLAPGRYQYEARARDAAGNEAQTGGIIWIS